MYGNLSGPTLIFQTEFLSEAFESTKAYTEREQMSNEYMRSLDT